MVIWFVCAVTLIYSHSEWIEWFFDIFYFFQMTFYKWQHLQSNYQIMHTNAYFFFCQCLIEVDQLIQFFFHLNNYINKSFQWGDIPRSALTMILIFFFVCVDTVDKLKAKKCMERSRKHLVKFAYSTAWQWWQKCLLTIFKKRKHLSRTHLKKIAVRESLKVVLEHNDEYQLFLKSIEIMLNQR